MKRATPTLILVVILSLGGLKAAADDVTTLTAPDGSAVVIYRDNYGVPHIRASTEAGVFFGQGYAVAQDRLFQMETFRRTALGRLSEVGLPSLETDIGIRSTTYTPAERAVQFARLMPEAQTMLESYVAGINKWLEAVHAEPLQHRPAEFFAPSLEFDTDDPRPWTVDDVVATSQLIMRRFGQFGGEELMRYQELAGSGFDLDWFNTNRPINDPDAPTTITGPSAGKRAAIGRAGKAAVQLRIDPRLIEDVNRRDAAVEAGLAANNFPPKLGSFATIVVPAKSASGNVMLLGAPQLGPPQQNTANMTHEVELDAPTLHVAGMTVAGIPGVIIGHTEHHAWTLTSGNSDNTDTFIEQLNEDGTAYRHDGSWLPFEVIPEPDLGIARVRTVHGPVVRNLPSQQAASWQMTFWDRELEMVEAFYEIWKAQSLEEFEASLRDVPMNFNVFYAGQDQQIKFYHVGTLLRNTQTLADHDPRLPRSGIGNEEWGDDPFLAFEELPQASGSVQDYFVNWNNKPSPVWNNGDNIPWSILFRPDRTLRVQKIEDYVGKLASISFDNLKSVPEEIGDHGTYQQVVEFTPTSIRNENVIPPGQSGFISAAGVPSPHFGDQWALHQTWAFKNMVFNEPVRVWPPNNKFRSFDVTDHVDAGEPEAAFLQTVWSDEDARKTPIRIADCQTVRLRADRHGGGNGRIYTVHVAAPDPVGYTGTAALFQVFVPKSASPEHAFAADDGPAVREQSECTGPEIVAESSGRGGPKLMQNRPNPFNPSTHIAYEIPEPAQIVLSVYNLLGQEVARLVDGVQEAGSYNVAFDGTGLSSGVYFYSLRTPGSVETRMMILQK